MEIQKLTKFTIEQLYKINAFTWSGWGMDIEMVKTHIEKIVQKYNLPATVIYYGSSPEIRAFDPKYAHVQPDNNYFYAMIDCSGCPDLYVEVCGYGWRDYIDNNVLE